MTQIQTNQTKLIPLASIFADSSWNCRGVISPMDVADLVADIPIKGLLQPVVVREWQPGEEHDPKHQYKLIAGFRRTYAMGLLNQTLITATIIADIDDAESAVINLAENIKRQDLTFMAEARAVERIMRKFRRSDYEFIGKKLGKSISWVKVRMDVLTNCPAVVQAAIDEGIVKVSMIPKLANMDQKQMLIGLEAIKRAVEKGEKVDQIFDVRRQPSHDQPRKRTPKQMLDMSEHFIKLYGNNPTSKVLAWSLGNISNAQLNIFMQSFSGDWKEPSYTNAMPQLWGESLPEPVAILDNTESEED